MTDQINTDVYVSLAEAASLMLANRRKVYILQGEPGIGKSSIMDTFEQQLGEDYNYVYFDCANKDLGDIAMPSVDRERRVTEYFLNGVFKHYNGKPMVIMLDEFSKAPAPIQNMLHPLLEARNPRLCDFLLPEGSIRFLTANDASAGLGDVLKAHTGNRGTRLNVRKSNAEEWIKDFAIPHKIDPVVMAWVSRFPHCMASYKDGGQDENPYIFNPRKVQTAFVSGRSLEMVSESIKNRHLVSDNALLADMIGTIGASAALDMKAYISYQDQLPTWDNIFNNPRTAPVPDSPGACAVLVFGAIARMDKSSMASFMTYLERFEPEWQAAFCINMAKTPSKQAVAFSCKSFADWVAANEDIL